MVIRSATYFLVAGSRSRPQPRPKHTKVFAPMTKVVTVLNQKGGVGKSTATVNLAAVRAQKLTAHLEPDAFSPVAAVSIDPQGSAKWWANRVDALPFHLVQAHDDPLEWLQQLNNLPGIVEVYVDTAGWFDLDADSSRDGLGDDTPPMHCGPSSTSPTKRSFRCCRRRCASTQPRARSVSFSNRATSPSGSSSMTGTRAMANTG